MSGIAYRTYHNEFESGIIPRTSSKDAYGGQKVQWCHTDTPENLNKNPHKDDWKNTDVTYTFNKQGFRTYDLVSLFKQPVNIALGCSHTLGVGMPIDSIWPTLIEKATGVTTLNLGIGGGSTDCVSRILMNVSSLYDVQTVFIAWPDLTRFEKYFPLSIQNTQSTNASAEDVWNMNDSQSSQRFYKNQAIVYMLSKMHNFLVKEVDANDIISKYRPDQRARDGMHPGFDAHKEFAETLLRL
jgi:hypothetical protein